MPVHYFAHARARHLQYSLIECIIYVCCAGGVQYTMNARTMHSLTRHVNQITVIVNEPDARMKTYDLQTKDQVPGGQSWSDREYPSSADDDSALPVCCAGGVSEGVSRSGSV
jgi:hypothetical protein